MAKTWVLDTETKGTAANVVPVERRRAEAVRERELALVEFERPPAPPRPQAPPQTRRFKVVDVMSSHVLVEGAETRETIKALEGLRSVLDARIFAWDGAAERWRLLTLAQSRALWAFRGRVG